MKDCCYSFFFSMSYMGFVCGCMNVLLNPSSRGTGESILYHNRLNSVPKISQRSRGRKTLSVIWFILVCFLRDSCKKIASLLCPQTSSFVVLLSFSCWLFFKNKYDDIVCLNFLLASGCKYSKRHHIFHDLIPHGFSKLTC